MKKVWTLVLCIGMLVLSACAVQHGASKDSVLSADWGISYGHVYLTNDHGTVYCTQNQNDYDVANKALEDGKKVVIKYTKGAMFSCGFCSAAKDYEIVCADSITEAKQ